MSVVIAQIKKENDADFVARLVKNMNGKAKVMSDEEWEDHILGKIAEQAEAEGGTVPREKIAKHFRKHGIDF